MMLQGLAVALLIGVDLIAGESTAVRPAGVVETYTVIAERQNGRLRGASMEVEIEASLPKLKKHGRLSALRRISDLGRITYEKIHFEGDKSIENEVIARYLAADAEAETSNPGARAISPANYRFKYKGERDDRGRPLYVFQLTPIKKRVGLFRGELWLDANTCLPVREAGRMVKNPSIFLKRIDFVREYEIRDGVAIPHEIASTVDTRLVGKAELIVRFQNISLAEYPVSSIATATGQ